LAKAVSQHFISQSEYSEVAEMYDHIGKMLTRWIDYLRRSDWKDRG
jgi:mRNA-degrading endonuclease HigB of HigAB toxin-antitoxin module